MLHLAGLACKTVSAEKYLIFAYAKIRVGTRPSSFGRAFMRIPGGTLS